MSSKLQKKPVFDWLNECIGFSCDKKNIKILKCEKSEADKIIIEHHYSHKPTKNSFLSFMVFWNGEVNGALQLGYGIRPKIKGVDNPDSVREFDSLW
jgi:hypothetical protein